GIIYGEVRTLKNYISPSVWFPPLSRKHAITPPICLIPPLMEVRRKRTYLRGPDEGIENGGGGRIYGCNLARTLHRSVRIRLFDEGVPDLEHLGCHSNNPTSMGGEIPTSLFVTKPRFGSAPIMP